MSGTVDGRTERFEKPWFITFVMCFGWTKNNLLLNSLLRWLISDIAWWDEKYREGFEEVICFGHYEGMSRILMWQINLSFILGWVGKWGSVGEKASVGCVISGLSLWVSHCPVIKVPWHYGFTGILEYQYEQVNLCGLMLWHVFQGRPLLVINGVITTDNHSYPFIGGISPHLWLVGAHLVPTC